MNRRRVAALKYTYPRQLAPILFTGLCLAGCNTTPLNRVSVDPDEQGITLPCDTWSEPQQVGALDHQIISEASGIGVSKAFEDRLYHNNDSGDGPYFYVTNGAGAVTQTVTIDGFEPSDVEAMALGPCPGQGTCLYLGDIGDNARARPDVRIVIIPEQEQFAERTTPLKIITAKYPDTAHDAEGMAVHPNGDIFILTKEFDRVTWFSHSAQLYRLSASQIAGDNGEVQEMEHLGELDLPWLLSDYEQSKLVVTGMDISSDGKRALILTYQTALEILLEPVIGALSQRQQIADENFRNIPIEELGQMEAIAYTADQNAFVYDTEYHEEIGVAAINQVACLNLRSES
jgi:hypothetical protein